MSGDATPIEVTVAEARALTEQGAALIDVREDWEFNHCHIDGAAHIPLQSLPQRLDEVPRAGPVVIQCHHGGRSMQAVRFLRAQGFDNVTNLQGGIDRWSLEIDPSIARY